MQLTARGATWSAAADLLDRFSNRYRRVAGAAADLVWTDASPLADGVLRATERHRGDRFAPSESTIRRAGNRCVESGRAVGESSRGRARENVLCFLAWVGPHAPYLTRSSAP